MARLLTLTRKPVPPLSTSSTALTQLLDLYSKGAEARYNPHASFDYLAYLFAELSKVCLFPSLPFPSPSILPLTSSYSSHPQQYSSHPPLLLSPNTSPLSPPLPHPTSAASAPHRRSATRSSPSPPQPPASQLSCRPSSLPSSPRSSGPIRRSRSRKPSSCRRSCSIWAQTRNGRKMSGSWACYSMRCFFVR